MVQKVNQLLNDKAWARWTALILISLACNVTNSGSYGERKRMGS